MHTSPSTLLCILADTQVDTQEDSTMLYGVILTIIPPTSITAWEIEDAVYQAKVQRARTMVWYEEPHTIDLDAVADTLANANR